MSELTKVDPGVVLSAPENARPLPSAVARRTAWLRSLLRFLLQLDHKLWRNTLLRRLLAAADALAILAAIALLVPVAHDPRRALWMMAFVPVWLVLAKAFGLYDQDHRSLRHLTIDEVPTVLVWLLTAVIATAALERAALGVADVADAFALLLLASVTCLAARAGTRALWRRVTPSERTLVIGGGMLAAATRRKIALFSDIHLDVVAERGECSAADLPTTTAWLEGIDRVILASQALDEALIARLVAICRSEKIKFSVVPPVRGMFGTAVQLSHVAELPVVEYNTWDISRSTMLLKRLIDVVVSLVALVLVVPLLALVALAIRLDSRGPVFFLQLRAGRDGRPFRMVKFRTMRADAPPRASDAVRKVPDDPRVTRVGTVLRKTSIDELPQLLNVLKGEMSLVGPRPEEVEIVNRNGPEHEFRLVVRPGLTGPMQVFGRGELTFEERLAVERDYVENLSLGRDFRILALTVSAVATGKGAF